jgi:hypothetical protein
MNTHLTLRARWLGAAAATLALGSALAGCGSSRAGDQVTGTPAAQRSALGAQELQAPPLSDSSLQSGSSSHRITATIVAFYRAASQDNATQACGLFTPAGRAGFMHAAKVSFPESINKYSSCEHAMEVYNATLADSEQTTEDNDPAFDPSALNNVGVALIQIHGSSATALAPTNVADLINPKRIYLVKTGQEWLIDGSKSLNASNLEKILAQAKAQGLLTSKRQGKSG